MIQALSFYDVGVMISERIRSYVDNGKQPRDLESIFTMLTEVAMKTLYREYNSIDPHILDDSANRIAEDTLMSIYRQPEHYVDNGHESFYPYYRSIIKKRMTEVFYDFYETHRACVPFLDTTDDEDYGYDHTDHASSPVDLVDRGDRYRLFVNITSSIVNSCPIFKDKSRYLVWPVVAALLQGDNSMFDSLPFRERVGLRVMLALVSNKKSLLREYI